MRGDTFENTGERAGADGVVVRNGLVVFAALLRGDADVRTALPVDRVAERAQRLQQGRASGSKPPSACRPSGPSWALCTAASRPLSSAGRRLTGVQASGTANA